MKHVAIGTLCLLLCAAITGCGDGKGSVSGTVNFDGQPVPEGSLTFIKDDGKTREGAAIKDGKFQTSIPPGKYKVEVNAQKVAGTRKQKGFDGKEEVIELREEMIPEWYNTKTELVEEIKPGNHTMNLDLKSKK